MAWGDRAFEDITVFAGDAAEHLGIVAVEGKPLSTEGFEKERGSETRERFGAKTESMWATDGVGFEEVDLILTVSNDGAEVVDASLEGTVPGLGDKFGGGGAGGEEFAGNEEELVGAGKAVIGEAGFGSK